MGCSEWARYIWTASVPDTCVLILSTLDHGRGGGDDGGDRSPRVHLHARIWVKITRPICPQWSGLRAHPFKMRLKSCAKPES